MMIYPEAPYRIRGCKMNRTVLYDDIGHFSKGQVLKDNERAQEWHSRINHVGWQLSSDDLEMFEFGTYEYAKFRKENPEWEPVPKEVSHYFLVRAGKIPYSEVKCSGCGNLITRFLPGFTNCRPCRSRVSHRNPSVGLYKVTPE